MPHGSTGTGALEFRDRLDQVAVPEGDNYLSRSLAVAEDWQKRARDSLGISGTDSLWGGRPDILLEGYTGDEEGVPDTVFIREVKYTRNPSFADQEIKLVI